MLREVAQVLTRREILATAVAPNTVPPTFPVFNVLLEEGYQQVDMVDGSAIVGRTHFYWTPAWADAMLEHVCWSAVERGLVLNAGNVVEVEQRGRLTTVARIKFRNLAEGGCAYRTESGDTVGTAPPAVKPIGDEGVASLHCAGLAEQGWSPERLSNGGIEWRKRPPVGQPSVVSTLPGQPAYWNCNNRRVP